MKEVEKKCKNPVYLYKLYTSKSYKNNFFVTGIFDRKRKDKIQYNGKTYITDFSTERIIEYQSTNSFNAYLNGAK